jgi:hypothetical protein
MLINRGEYMPAITAENRDFWQDLANNLHQQRPHVGREVKIEKGRKHKGKQGKVIQHKLDQYDNAYRYGNDASHHYRDMAGRSGWVCLVETSNERFWVKASYTVCIDAQANKTLPCDIYWNGDKDTRKDYI